VKVVFDKKAAAEMGSQKYYHGLIAEKETEKGVELVFATNSLEYTAKWLLTFTGEVEIISNDDLKQTVLELAKEIKEKYL
jgi:predicted DNA-binding transcriptional regulator YafY